MIYKILVEMDWSCDMARVSVNGKCVAGGNFWDFHPGGDGNDEYLDEDDDYNTPGELAYNIKNKLLAKGIEAEIINSEYSWEDEQ